MHLKVKHLTATFALNPPYRYLHFREHDVHCNTTTLEYDRDTFTKFMVGLDIRSCLSWTLL